VLLGELSDQRRQRRNLAAAEGDGVATPKRSDLVDLALEEVERITAGSKAARTPTCVRLVIKANAPRAGG
jgi:hypothetical protein